MLSPIVEIKSNIIIMAIGTVCTSEIKIKETFFNDNTEYVCWCSLLLTLFG